LESARTGFLLLFGAQDRYEKRATQRERWAAELKAGRNPFDAATLEALRGE
jgi:hypothetical protein